MKKTFNHTIRFIPWAVNKFQSARVLPKKRRRVGFFTSGLGALIILYSCTVPGPLFVPDDETPTCVVSQTNFEGWFTDGTVTLNGAVKPADSVNFTNNPNCDFYLWSEQMFLWLTSPASPQYGGGRQVFNSGNFFTVSPLDENFERTFIPNTVAFSGGNVVGAGGGTGTTGNFSAKTAMAPDFMSVRSDPVGTHGIPIAMEKGTGRIINVIPSRLSELGNSLVETTDGRFAEVIRIEVQPRQQEKQRVAGEVKVVNKAVLFDRNNLPINVKLPLELDPTSVPGFKTRQLKTLDQANLGLRLQTQTDGPIIVDSFLSVIVVEQAQAFSGAVLMAQNGSLVYYVSMVNDVFAWFRTLNPGPNLGSGTPALQFPTNQSELDDIINFASANGKTLHDTEALTIEIKTAWIEAVGLDIERFITIRVRIPTYDTTNPLEWPQNGSRMATLALVGMHVVGTTTGHPEMIWATFEHVMNAPNAEYAYNKPTGTVTVPQMTFADWLFSVNGSSGLFNEIHMTLSVPSTGPVAIKAISPHTIGPSDTIRSKAWGTISSPSSNTEIISINNSVIGKLVAGDVRRNYVMTGATWTIFGQSPTPSNQVGTNKLNSTVLETYFQGKTAMDSALNCFSCHTTNTVDVSNIWESLKPLNP